MEELSVGRIVHIQTHSLPSVECRPAIVVSMISTDHGMFNGVMWLDGKNDDPITGHLNRWVTSVSHRSHRSEQAEQYIDWHWPSECSDSA